MLTCILIVLNDIPDYFTIPFIGWITSVHYHRDLITITLASVSILTQ